jgi:N-hydroxyarylamine O-acetyltransferase
MPTAQTSDLHAFDLPDLEDVLSANEFKLLNEYLVRIGYTGSLEKTYECLAKLHECHALHITYDTLEIIAGEFSSEKNIYNTISRITTCKLGATCYPQNSVLQWVLSIIGFDSWMIGARTVHGVKNMANISARTHFMLCVRCEDVLYLCDVAYGSLRGPDFGIPIRPIPVVADGKIYRQFDHYFRIIHREGLYGRLLQWHNGSGEWNDVYSFTLEPSVLSDHKLVKLSVIKPESAFQCNYLCTRVTRKGRLYLLNRNLSICEGPVVTTSNIKSSSEMEHVLNHTFDIYPNEEQLRIIWSIAQKSKL